MPEEQRFSFQYYFDIDSHEEDYQAVEDSSEPDHVQLFVDQMEDEYAEEAQGYPPHRDKEDDIPF
jgi:hypothetical protein